MLRHVIPTALVFGILTTTLLIVGTRQVQACDTWAGPSTVPHAQLVKETPRILLAKLKRIEEIRGEGSSAELEGPPIYERRHHFEIVERLKGPEINTFVYATLAPDLTPSGSETFFWPRFSTPTKKEASDHFNHHHHPFFWENWYGRAGFLGICGSQIPIFHTGSTYLLFLGYDHEKGFELIESDTDAWLQATRKLIRDPNLSAGASQSVKDYLAGKENLAIGQWTHCDSLFQSKAKRQGMNILERLKGSATEIDYKGKLFGYTSPDRGFECQVGDKFLAIHYGDIYPMTLLPIREGKLNLVDLKMDLNLTGKKLLPIEELRGLISQ